ncbi:SHOCT domain-containing protein [Kitasatospora viridis]|uniref:Putative oligomerization/nucleic acid binding protein n=1 Tax=Kitasatospora viridis TaxID=281105 RepID=A0A561UQF2_9ACTN|nr:SHOCT domain-containing protein [Kitasatospora viridis]TWG01559.1 putative oligomerization/nucleic acid binding protein [Kitasatospora viridis]
MHDYPLLNLFWTMLEFFLWILWLFLLFKVISDIFRSHDMSGWGKAGWLTFVILLPFIGILIYLIARGQGMGRRDAEQVRQSEAAFRSYIRDAAGTPDGPGGSSAAASHVDELARLAELKRNGDLSEEEYQKAKQKLLA